MSSLFLKPGDKVAITAPASRVDLSDVLVGSDILKSWGLQVTTGSTVGNSDHNFSDTYENRLDELQAYLDDPSIRCIMAARGGYGVSDLIDSLDFSQFVAHPKWIVGFSDLTALLLHLNHHDFEAIHGPMAKTLIFDSYSTNQLKNVLFGGQTTYRWESPSGNRVGNTIGRATGGNLVLLAHSIGSASDISYDGKILFIEEISEKMYNIDRLMVQLKRAGKLRNLAGIVTGSFTDISENSVPFGKTVKEIILHHTHDYNYPVAFGFQFGHENVNLPVVMGRKYMLHAELDHAVLTDSYHEGV